MSTLAKEDICFQLIDRATWSGDTSSHTVVMQPQSSSYPSGAIACSHGGSGWYSPDSDLDDEEHYYIYVDGSKKRLWIARESSPAINL